MSDTPTPMSPDETPRLRFAKDVEQRATNKENVADLTDSFNNLSSFGGSAKFVSPGTFLRKHPVRYAEHPLTPGTSLRTPRAPESRWTPTSRASDASPGTDFDDEDELEDGDGDDGDAIDDGAASPTDDGKLCRESFGMFHRQQAAIDAAAASDDPPPAIKIIKSAPDQKTPAVPRYVKSYRETPDSAESRCSEWTPRGGDDDSDSDSEDDAGMALSP